VRWAVVMSSGFSEFSAEGSGVEAEIAAILRRYGMRLVGPNCLGLLNTENRLAATIGPIPYDLLQRGGVSVLAQSGSVTEESALAFSLHKVGVAKCVSIGNKLNANEVDYLTYFLQHDSATRQVAMYLEGITDGHGLFEQARQSPKPIVFFKANIIPGGSPAARSHTAALASDDRVVDAVCRQANMARAHTMAQFVCYTKALSMVPMRGDRVGVVGTSGGAGVMVSDYCYQRGLALPEFPPAVLARIDACTRSKAIQRRNPLDLGDNLDFNVVLDCLESVVSDPSFDAAVLILPHFCTVRFPGPTVDEMGGRIAGLVNRLQKPIAVSFSPIMAPVEHFAAAAGQFPFPVFDRPDEAIEALAVSWNYWRRAALPRESPPRLQVDKEPVRQALAAARAAGQRALNEKALEILAAYGLCCERLQPAATSDEAVAIARGAGFPVALKVRSPEISHKSDAGGVELDLADEETVRQAFRRIIDRAAAYRPAARIDGVSVQKMIPRGLGQEVIVGGKRDAQFGPVIMLGSGGVLVELFQDVSLRLAPLTRHDAEEMLDEVRAGRLLRGFRGERPCDIEALVAAMLRVSQLLCDFPEIAEVDVNPLKVLPEGQGCCAVDARIFLEGVSHHGTV